MVIYLWSTQVFGVFHMQDSFIFKTSVCRCLFHSFFQNSNLLQTFPAQSTAHWMQGTVWASWPHFTLQHFVTPCAVLIKRDQLEQKAKICFKKCEHARWNVSVVLGSTVEHYLRQNVGVEKADGWWIFWIRCHGQPRWGRDGEKEDWTESEYEHDALIEQGLGLIGSGWEKWSNVARGDYMRKWKEDEEKTDLHSCLVPYKASN